MANSKQDAIDFLDAKGAEFHDELSALFSKYEVNADITGSTLASLLSLGGSISKEITDIFNGKSSFDGEGYENFGSGKLKGLLEKGKNAVAKGKTIVGNVKGKLGNIGSDQQDPDPQPDPTSNTKKYIIIGSIVIVFLVIVFIIIKKARG